MLRANAQVLTTEPSRFYLGVTGILGHYEAVYPRIQSYDEAVLAPSLTAGYQLASRVAVQLSAARSQDKLYIDFFDQTPTGQQFLIGSYRENHQHVALPVILRLTVTRGTSRKLQFDALAGVVLLHASYQRIFEDFDKQQRSIAYREQNEQTTNVALSLGGGMRYRFSHRLEAVADANFNRTISSTATSGFLAVYTVGLRYRFGYH